MNKKVFFTWLTLAGMIAASACVPQATEAPATEGPAADLPSEEDLQQIVAFTFRATEDLATWTIPLKAAPLKAVREYGGKLPDDWPAEAAQPAEVGVVEIGPGGAANPGRYVVAIDLASQNDRVPGVLASTLDPSANLVYFLPVAQKLNPARGNDAKVEAFKTLDPPPDVAVGIRADTVCFVVKTDKDPPYSRYCSESGSMLSVRDNFDSQYKNLQSSIAGAVDVLIGNNALGSDVQLQTDRIISEMEDPGNLDHCSQQILNTAQAIQPPTPTPTEEGMKLEFEPPTDPVIPGTPKPSLALSQSDPTAFENPEALQAACGSDITVAPVMQGYFDEKYQSLPTPTSSRFIIASILAPAFLQNEPTPITVAVVQVHQPIDTSLGTVFSGDYRLDYWFHPGGEFYAATITGALTDGTPVSNQPVPAVPATFINNDETEQPGAQISTCRIFGRCTFFQSSCS